MFVKSVVLKNIWLIAFLKRSVSNRLCLAILKLEVDLFYQSSAKFNAYNLSQFFDLKAKNENPRISEDIFKFYL